MYILYSPTDNYFELSFSPSNINKFGNKKITKIQGSEYYVLDADSYFFNEKLIIIENGKMKIGTNKNGEVFAEDIIIHDEIDCDDDILTCIKDYMQEGVEHGRRSWPRYFTDYGMGERQYKQLIKTIEEYLFQVHKMYKKERQDVDVRKKQAYTAAELLQQHYNNI